MRREQLAGLAAGAIALAAFAQAPVQIEPVFVDRVPRAYLPKRGVVPPPACPVNVIQVSDDRRAKDTVGTVGGRSAKAPEDTATWLRSIMGGLNARGFAVAFEPDRAPAASDITMSVSLKSIWLTSILTNKAGTVVMHVHAEREGKPVLDKDFRGNLTNTNWMSTRDELTNLTNATFAEALNAMAPELWAMCDH
jgi:hypothetical protein